MIYMIIRNILDCKGLIDREILRNGTNFSIFKKIFLYSWKVFQNVQKIHSKTGYLSRSVELFSIGTDIEVKSKHFNL